MVSRPLLRPLSRVTTERHGVARNANFLINVILPFVTIIAETWCPVARDPKHRLVLPGIPDR